MTNTAKKEIGITLFAVLVTAVVFTVLAIALPLLHRWPLAVSLAMLVIIWLALMLVVLTLGRRVLTTAVLCLVPGILLVLLSRLNPVVIGGAVLLSIFTLLASRTLIREEQNRLYYRTTHLFGGAARLLTLGTLIAVTSLAWPVLEDSVKNARFEISERQVAPLLKPIEPIIGDFFPGYSSGASIDELIDASVAEEKKNLPPGASIDPAQEARIRQDIKDRLGENITGREGLAAVVAGKINRQINTMATQNPVQASLILAILAFLTLRALLPFIVWPTLILVAALVQLVIHSQLGRIETQEVVMERLRL